MSASFTPDVVVVGSGPNGLVGANLLADAGWRVLVLEAEDSPGGAVRCDEAVHPGFVRDRFSSFYPLALGSPVIRNLRLEDFGLRWRHAPAVVAHPLLDGRAAVLSRDVDETARSVDAFAAGDGDVWRRIVAQWKHVETPLIDALFTPFPPVKAGARLLWRLGFNDALRFARFGVLSARRYSTEEFDGEGGPMLLAGNALHTDLALSDSGSALFGWLLSMLGSTVGFPVPEGGSGKLTEALVARLRARGGEVRCNSEVTEILVRDRRAVGVRLADGDVVDAGKAVLADVTAPQLYLRLVGAEHLPAGLLADLRRFQWDDATVKVDWALSGPIPWSMPGPAQAGTVHVGGNLNDLSVYSHHLELGRVPPEPFMLLGQMTTSDPTRSPAGTESAWAYTHVPARPLGDGGGELLGDWGPADRERFVDRMEAQIEAYAPGFRERILNRVALFPQDLEEQDANLVGGSVNGGSSEVWQQLFFRPTPALGRPETPIAGLFLASASAHPGGGVHGACGANAARAAMRASTTGRFALALTRHVTSGASRAARAGGASRRSVP